LSSSQKPLALVIVILVLAVYGNAFTAGFRRWDDPMLITENPAIRGLTPRAVWGLLSRANQGTYLPLRVLSYAVDYRIWGLHPFGYHATNVLLHAINCVLVYQFALIVLGRRSGALIAAMMFAVHPVHTEGVTWASGRKEGLCGLFFFCSLLAYARVGEGGRVRLGAYVACWAAMVCAMLSKGTAVVLPAVFVLYDLFFRRSVIGRKARSLAAHYGPFWFTALALAALHVWVGKSAGAIHEYHGTGPWSNFLTMCKAFAWYWGLQTLPIHLCARYHFPPVLSALAPWALAGFVVVGAFVLTALALRRTAGGFALWWMPLTLLPVLNIVPISMPIAERYLYVPLAGYCLLAALVVGGGRGHAHRVVMCAVLLCYAALSVQRNWAWHSGEGLWGQTVRKFPTCVDALGNLAAVEFRAERFRTADALLRRSSKVRPDNADIHASLGKVLRKLGRGEEAIAALREAARLDPNDAGIFATLGLVLKERRDLRGARAAYERALSLDDEMPSVHNNFGVLLADLGDRTNAREHYLRAIDLDPDHASAYYNLGRLFRDQGQWQKAAEQYAAAAEKKPDYASAHDELANALVHLGREAEAMRRFRIATHFAPSLWRSQMLLAIDALRNGRTAEARHRFEAVLRVNPREETARRYLEELR